jgi:ArsR family transcriptional regulator
MMALETWFKALADPTRLRILGLTLSRELNVQELMEILSMGQSRVSRHLRILTDGGLLACRRDGLWSFYRVPAEGAGRRFLDTVAPLLAGEAVFQKDRERAARLAAAGRGRSRRFFDALAPEWDRRKAELLGAADLGREVLARLPSCAVAADLGCGTGGLLASLAGKAAAVIGVDSSPRMLELARRACASLPKVELRLGELEHLPLREGEAEAAVLNLVLHHLRLPVEGLREAHRVLRPGGTLVLADLDRHQDPELAERFGDRWPGFAPGELEGWLAEAGFRIAYSGGLPLARGLTARIITAKSRKRRRA